MSLHSQQYANLSSDAYKDYSVGVRAPGQKDVHTIGGAPPFGGEQYEILEHYSNPKTGYQGTIYQRVGSGEIVVAHRGTEVGNGKLAMAQDVVVDAVMVDRQSNLQARDAIELTRRAIVRANDIGQETGRVPDVSVTGHSLGGCLAQISAHHFGLKGETFNAYGAASLNLGIPKGGSDVTNHVMASVSSAPPRRTTAA